MSAACVPHECRSSYFYMWIDILDATGRLRHLCWTRRRHDLDQSNPILCERGPAMTFCFNVLEKNESLVMLYDLYDLSEQKTRPSHSHNHSSQPRRLADGAPKAAMDFLSCFSQCARAAGRRGTGTGTGTGAGTGAGTGG